MFTGEVDWVSWRTRWRSIAKGVEAGSVLSTPELVPVGGALCSTT